MKVNHYSIRLVNNNVNISIKIGIITTVLIKLSEKLDMTNMIIKPKFIK